MKAKRRFCVICQSSIISTSDVCQSCKNIAKVGKDWFGLIQTLDDAWLDADDTATMIREYLIREREDEDEDSEDGPLGLIGIDLAKEEIDDLIHELCDHIEFFYISRESREVR